MLSPIVSRPFARQQAQLRVAGALAPATARRGLTMIEVLVVMGIIGGLVGLVTPAVQSVREAANRAECQNRQKQIGLALIESNDAWRRMPPAIDWYPQNEAYGTVWLHLLPFTEQGDLYRQAMGPGGQILPPYPDVAATPVKLYQCPSDPSLGSGVLTASPSTAWGASSYAVNAQVFCVVYPYLDALGNWSPWAGWYYGAGGQPALQTSFPDGTTYTILVGEKYAQCNNQPFTEGGSAWAYYLTTDPNVKPYHAGFSISWQSYDIGPDSKFLVQPTPFTGPQSRCDPTLASTPHGSGMTVLLADGHVRTLAPTLSDETWWAACTPNAGDLTGPDW